MPAMSEEPFVSVDGGCSRGHPGLRMDQHPALLHGILAAVLTRRRFKNNNGLRSHGEDPRSFQRCPHMHYFPSMPFFLASHVYLRKTHPNIKALSVFASALVS